jgi:hypothetical protein
MASAQEQALEDMLDEQNLLFNKTEPFKMMPIGGAAASCATKNNNCTRGDRKLWAVHNFMMWLAWVALMCVIVCSARYFRHKWRKSIYIHATIGITIFIISVVGPLMAWGQIYKTFGYFMHWNKWSSLLENVASFAAWGLCISGMWAWFKRRFGTYEWGTTFVLKIGKVHRYFGQIFCFGLQGLIIFAIIDNFGFSPTWIVVSVVQFLVLALIFLGLEIRH